MKLEAIIKANALSMSLVGVTIDRRFPHVLIEDQSGDGQEAVFLQGDDAAQFEAECEALYKSCPDLMEDEIQKHVAMPYTDLWQ